MAGEYAMGPRPADRKRSPRQVSDAAQQGVLVRSVANGKPLSGGYSKMAAPRRKSSAGSRYRILRFILLRFLSA